MTNKLSGLLAIMAFILLTLTWCLRSLFGEPAMEPETILGVGVLVMLVTYFLVGRVIAWLGIRLVQEQIHEKRAQEEERMHQARLRQQELAAQEAQDLTAARASGAANAAASAEPAKKTAPSNQV